jgi:hypothetical protein
VEAAEAVEAARGSRERGSRALVAPGNLKAKLEERLCLWPGGVATVGGAHAGEGAGGGSLSDGVGVAGLGLVGGWVGGEAGAVASVAVGCCDGSCAVSSCDGTGAAAYTWWRRPTAPVWWSTTRPPAGTTETTVGVGHPARSRMNLMCWHSSLWTGQ